MRPIGFARTALLISVAAAQPTFAQSISFGRPWTNAEACADNADMLARAPGDTLARKLRLSFEGRWRRFPGTDAQLEAAFLRENRCMLHTVAPDKCPGLQKTVNAMEVGDTLGARLLMLFPEETADMRAKYAEVFFKTFCPSLTLQSAATSPGKPSSTVSSPIIYVSVDMATDADGFVSPALVGMRETTKHFTAALFKRRTKAPFLAARDKATADLVISLLGREAPDDDIRVVRARVFIGEHAFDFDGLDDDGEWKVAAERAAAEVIDWVVENHARIVQGRK
jgi:hypothetical protein